MLAVSEGGLYALPIHGAYLIRQLSWSDVDFSGINNNLYQLLVIIPSP
jgi:hypothetical protein